MGEERTRSDSMANDGTGEARAARLERQSRLTAPLERNAYTQDAATQIWIHICTLLFSCSSTRWGQATLVCGGWFAEVVDSQEQKKRTVTTLSCVGLAVAGGARSVCFLCLLRCSSCSRAGSESSPAKVYKHFCMV